MKQRLRLKINFRTVGCLLVVSVGVAFLCYPLVARGAMDGPEFPYQAFALRDGTLVRSGPGAAHYATDELKQGQPVEVWRHDPGGWCAIRPTPESFSLIPAAAVETLSADRCRVLQSGLQAWVGTRLGPVENPLWQVKLNADEELVILGEVTWPSPEGTSLTWFQIAPPNGEFRWVQLSELQVPDARTQLPIDIDRPAGAYRDRAVRPTGQFEELERPLEFNSRQPTNSRPASSGPGRKPQGTIVDPFGDEEQGLLAPGLGRNEMIDGGGSSAGWRRARRPLNHSPLTPSPAAQSSSGSNSLSRPDDARWAGGSVVNDPAGQSAAAPGGKGAAIDRPTGRDLSAPGNNRPESWAGASSPITPTPGSESLPAQLRQIDVDLSMEIVKPAGQWQFSRLVQQLNDAYATAVNSTERNQAQQLIAKIDRLKELQFSLTGKQAPDESRPANRGGPATIGNGIAANVEFGTTYDAYGWLSECVQESGRAPSTFVLQDDNGKIICQVTPAPGYNLHRYLKTKVGVIGQRGFNQKLNLNHVLVDRVVVLENPNSTWR